MVITPANTISASFPGLATMSMWTVPAAGQATLLNTSAKKQGATGVNWLPNPALEKTRFAPSGAIRTLPNSRASTVMTPWALLLTLSAAPACPAMTAHAAAVAISARLSIAPPCRRPAPCSACAAWATGSRAP